MQAGVPERASLLFCYAFGKAQRLLAELHQLGVHDTVLLHGAMVPITQAYRDEGIAMVPTEPVSSLPRNADMAGRLVLVPLGAPQPLDKRFKAPQTGFASGWMARSPGRRGYERGFVLSDHADTWAAANRARLQGPTGVCDPRPKRRVGPLPPRG